MVIESSEQEKNMPTGKKVLLFSGGADSLIFNYLLNPDILLVIPHGNKYEQQELMHINNLIEKKIIDKTKVVFDKRLFLGDIERVDSIIPLRNLFFIEIATFYGEEIFLGSVFGDRSSDKSIEFFNKCSDILTYVYQDSHWCKERKILVSSPFKELTKTELVKLFLEKGGDSTHLLESYSCYGGEKPEGWCKACFRKWVSLENNNIDTKDYFQNNPWDAPWLPEILPKILKHEYRGREDFEIIEALKKVGRI